MRQPDGAASQSENKSPKMYGFQETYTNFTGEGSKTHGDIYLLFV